MGVDNLNEEKMDELLRMMRSVVPDISDMTDAGRIGFVTRGQYSGAESYENLDVVLYGGSLWTPKKDTTGNPPPETQRNEDGTPASNEFWQLFLPGALGDDYVKKTDIAKAPTETESGKPGVNFPDGKTIQIDENGMLTGTPLDFMGTWKELQDGIASGEITEGMIGYIEGTSDNPEDPDHPNNFLFDIDDFLSTVSSNAVQNRIVTAALNRLEQLENETRALRASLESFGLVKIAPVDLVDVTEDNGLVLGAKEKNASVEGTLASEIEKLKTVHRGTIELNSNFTIYGTSYTKCGRIATVFISVTNGGSAFEKGRINIGTLPDFLIPDGGIYIRIAGSQYVNSNLNRSCSAVIDSSGTINVDNFEYEDVRQVYFNFTYITKY